MCSCGALGLCSRVAEFAAGQRHSVLKFPTNALPAYIDKFLLALEGEAPQPLWMPVRLSHGGPLGAAPQAVQAIATWAQSQAGRVLHLAHPYGSSKDTQNRFAGTLPGMTALYFTDKVESGDTTFSRFEALKAVAPLVKAMDAGEYGSTMRGQAAALVCFAGARSEFLNTLYSRSAPDAVRGSAEFRSLLRSLLGAMSGGLPGQLDDTQLGLLSALVYQLFLNTDQHGAFDANGRRYDLGVRGISVKLTSIGDLPELISLAGEDVPLKAYLAKMSVVKTSSQGDKAADHAKHSHHGRPVRLIEISVFDTGPGMGLRWLAKKDGVQSYDQISIDDELAAVRECFEKHATTKSVQNAGVGLYTAVNAMAKLNAFMTLRTGRMSLYQDFSTLHAPSSFSPKLRLPKGKAAPRIAGTGYTVCFKVA